MKLHRSKWMRSLVLPVLKLAAVDISIAHPWTHERFLLNIYRHKAYWYHGRKRESTAMEAFARLIAKGETVVEVGGHIGYLSLWFSQLAGPAGHVFVFEPGLNNLPYLRRNLIGKPNITLVEKGCGAEAGELTFFEDDLSGQNNSFVKDLSVLKENARNAPGVRVTVEARKVEVCRLDAFMTEAGRRADFVKIDTEGFELSVLQGCTALFRQNPPPKFMVEVLADKAAILEMFTQQGYHVFDEAGQRYNPDKKSGLNLFMLHPLHHRDAITRWAGNEPSTDRSDDTRPPL